MISVHFQGKPFIQHYIIHIYAPTTNAKEAEVDQFYQNLGDLIEHTHTHTHKKKKNHKKQKNPDVLFTIDNWNAKVGS